jgi:FdrA protein
VGDPGSIQGLFSGGTLAGEAFLRLEAMLPEVASNLSGHRAEKLAAQASSGHCVIDLGADELTVGRPHPMIDPQLVVEHLARAAADSAVGTILVDVVLGDGAHPDPAALLAPAVERALAPRKGDLEVLAVVVGTDEDGQDLADQRRRLEEAGARLFATLDEAVDAALASSARARSPTVELPSAALAPPLEAVNIGLELFHDSLVEQGATAVHVDWRPPAGGNEKLAGILRRLKPSA